MGKLSKRNILWIVPIGILAVFWYFYGPQKDITDNEYITYVKNYSYENSAKTLESAFSSACENPYWVYFETQKGQDVVEFEGDCTVNNEVAKVNVQFLVDNDITSVQSGAMLVDSKMQEEADRDEFLLALAK
ncbi:glucosamine 6-phosphate synthetase [Lysinibacillus sp. JK80]|uniref:glucosamine 6-phosphate synthetase n=1 Tax=Lysinibacillus sp. JK80 TaxID=2749809 RepID=UPI0022B99D04|nr:glucosamine 6-phosphate synthetase [Lysinibacillus sp. JK80]WBF55453.1 glucosamine 6-phosphate synthetase [Lysinibacillus sp. JK80]